MKKRGVDRYYESIHDDFSIALAGDSESERAWSAVSRLRRKGSRLIFEVARSWITAKTPRQREVAVEVLCQLRVKDRTEKFGSHTIYVSESFELIKDLPARENNLSALQAELYALGHLYLPEAVPYIVPFASHPDSAIRFAVAWSLGNFHGDPISAKVLRQLMSDPDRDVRNWATFGLGVQGDADSEDLRQEFLHALSDEYFDVKMEAACALAKRDDWRVVQPLAKLFDRYGNINGLIEAARSLLQLDEDPGWSAKEWVIGLRAGFPESFTAAATPPPQSSPPRQSRS